MFNLLFSRISWQGSRLLFFLAKTGFHGRLFIKIHCVIKFCRKVPRKKFFKVFLQQVYYKLVTSVEIEKNKPGCSALVLFRQKSNQPSNNTI
jgi:hypothetical protein